MSLERVISGFQDGADMGGILAARRFGIPTGGWMPKGFLTESGPHPEYADLYGAREHPSDAYPPRTRANVEMADATIVFDTSASNTLESLSRGSQLAIRMAMRYEQPSLVVRVELGEPSGPKRWEAVAGWIRKHRVETLNVGGNRESRAPGIGAWVEEYLSGVFRVLSPADAGRAAGREGSERSERRP